MPCRIINPEKWGRWKNSMESQNVEFRYFSFSIDIPCSAVGYSLRYFLFGFYLRFRLNNKLLD